jgi:lycopene cyclase domain-containing protein
MLKFGYFAMLTFTVVGSFWLEIFLKVGVLRRIKRAMLAILPTAAIFLTWDYYAVTSRHWFFDREQVVGIFGRSSSSCFNDNRSSETGKASLELW